MLPCSPAPSLSYNQCRRLKERLQIHQKRVIVRSFNVSSVFSTDTDFHIFVVVFAII